jgi:hypothetical protein
VSDSLRQEVLAGAEFSARGSFTLAKEKAREKLRSFALINPRYYILQIIQALVASGARRIQITHGKYDLPMWIGVLTELDAATAADMQARQGFGIKLEFDGPGYTPYEVENIYDYLFESQNDETNDRLRCLALGLISCEELKPLSLELRSGDAVWNWRGGKETFKLLTQRRQHNDDDEAASTQAHHYVAIHYRHDAAGDGEIALVRESCTTVPAYLSVNDYPVSSPGPARYGSLCPRPALPFREDVKLPDGSTRPLEGVLGLPYVGLDRTKLHILRYGVLVNIKMEAELQPSVLAVIEHRPLRQNASQTGVVEDDIYRQCINRTQQHILDFARSLCSSPSGSQPQPVRDFLLQVMQQWLTREIVMGAPEDAPTELRALLAMPLFSDLAGVRRSLQSIAAQYRHDGFVSVVGRRYPYLSVGPWLVLNPSREEQQALLALFENVRDVEDSLHSVVAAMRGNRGALAPSGPPPSSAPPMRGCELPVDSLPGRRLKIYLEDAYPSGLCRLLGWDGPQLVGITLPLNGWSITVDLGNVTGLRDWGELARVTQLMLAQHGQQLYVKLQETVARGRMDASLSHARQHLLAWWWWRLNEALRQAGPTQRADAVREAGRAVLGDEAWNLPLFETRAGGRVSLADIETWLQHADRMYIAVGGSRAQHRDNALDASPAASAFLGRLFGRESFEQATLQMILPPEQQLQNRLVGASRRSLAEWEQLQRDRDARAAELAAQAEAERRAAAEAADLATAWKQVRQEARARQTGPSTTDKVLEGSGTPAPANAPARADESAPVTIAPSPPNGTPATPLAAPPAEAMVNSHEVAPNDDAPRSKPPVAVPEDAHPRSQPPPATPPPRQADRDMPFSAASPTPPAPPPETRLAEHAFNEKSLSGFLALTLEVEPLVDVSYRNSRLGSYKLFNLPISGWIESAERLPATVTSALAAIDWTRDQARILEGHVRLLYDSLASRMSQMDADSPQFARGRQHLISYLRRFLNDTRERLHAARPDDEVVRLRFLPVGGGSLASLATLAQQTHDHGYLRVLPEGGRSLTEDEPAAIVGPTVPENFYKMLFNTMTRPPDWNPAEPADVRLLAALRRELRLLRHDGDLRLTDEVLSSIQYRRGLRALVRYDPYTSETFLDPGHPTLRQLIAQFDRDRTVLPLLACVIYGAINRALEEVGDQHEMAFMTALLESAPKEPRP